MGSVGLGSSVGGLNFGTQHSALSPYLSWAQWGILLWTIRAIRLSAHTPFEILEQLNPVPPGHWLLRPFRSSREQSSYLSRTCLPRIWCLSGDPPESPP